LLEEEQEEGEKGVRRRYFRVVVVELGCIAAPGFCFIRNGGRLS